jgi:hypothetical protein
VATYELDCADCLEPTAAGRKDAKYCRSCALLRVLTYAAKLPRTAPKCRICGAKFRPLHNKDYSVCGQHDYVTTTTQPISPCAFCKTPTPPYRGVSVCLPCLKDPQTRPRVVSALERGQALRKARNTGRERRDICRTDT